MLSRLIYLISHWEQSYVMHMSLHTNLQGFIAEGNQRANALVAPTEMATIPNVFQQAKLSHQQFHPNVPGLVHQFHLQRDQAKAIVATCPNCQRFSIPSLGSEVNPRGLNSCEVWQMDAIHILTFGRLKYIHISVDAFSGAVYASAHTGEKLADAQKHLVQAFSMLWISKFLKTDNLSLQGLQGVLAAIGSKT